MHHYKGLVKPYVLWSFLLIVLPLALILLYSITTGDNSLITIHFTLDNFRKIQEQVYETIGKKPNIIRFPGGSSNTISKKYCVGVMTEVTKKALDEGFRYFDWNVDSDDAGHAKTRDDVYKNVTSKIKPGRENVVLMHDFSHNHKTLEALSDIIDYGLQNGYVFRKITDDTKMVTHSVNN